MNSSKNEKQDVHDLEKTCFFPYAEHIDTICRTLENNTLSHITRFKICLTHLRALMTLGYCGQDIIVFLHDTLSSTSTSPYLFFWLKSIGIVQHRIKHSQDSFIQLVAMIAILCRVYIDDPDFMYTDVS